MGGSPNFQNDRAVSSTTSAVADIIAALELPSISPLATDIVGLSSLHPLPEPGSRRNVAGDAGGQGTNNQLDVARSVMDSCVDAIDELRKHQNRCAALAAKLIEKLESSVALEGGILAGSLADKDLPGGYGIRAGVHGHSGRQHWRVRTPASRQGR